MSLWPKRQALNEHPALFTDVFCCCCCVLPGLPKFWVSLPIISRITCWTGDVGSPVSAVYRRGQRTMQVPFQPREEPLKSRILCKWCFGSNRVNWGMSRLYQLLESALPCQRCQAWGNSNCSWAGDSQILLQKSLSPLPSHPAPATSSPPYSMCLFQGRVWNLFLWRTRPGMLSNHMEGVPGRKAAEFALNSANQRQKCDYQVNLPCVRLPCFGEKHKSIISPFFLSLQKTLYSGGCRHKHWSAGCPRQHLSGILIYSHSGFGKVIVFLKQRKETEKKNIKGVVMYLYKIFCDKFSAKVRKVRSDWIEKNLLEPPIIRLAWLLQCPASVSEVLKPEIESDSLPQLPFSDSTAPLCNSLKTLKCLSLPVRKDFLFLFLRH